MGAMDGPPPPPPGRAPTAGARDVYAPGRRIGKYEVVRELARGGMGVVLVVRDPDLDRRLAMKLILGVADAEAVARFGREAQVMARVRHPNVVGIHELGRAPEGPFLVSDLVEGECLRDRLGRPLEPREAARIARALADGLAACHAAGVIHRDLKPHNVIVKPDGQPVLLDFGIARDESVERMTRTGELLGTPNYMAPEQADGTHPSALDARVDVYGLGAILFEALAGRMPFHDATAVLTILKMAILDEPAWPRATNPAVPPELEAVVKVAMAKDREARHPTAAALRDDLDRWLHGERPWAADRVPTPRRSRRRLAVPVAALLFLVAAGAAALSTGRGLDAARKRQEDLAARTLTDIQGAPDPAEAAVAWLSEHPTLDPELVPAGRAVQGFLDGQVAAIVSAEGASLQATRRWLEAHPGRHVARAAMRAREASLQAEASGLRSLLELARTADTPEARRDALLGWRCACPRADCAAVTSMRRLAEDARANLPIAIASVGSGAVHVAMAGDDRAVVVVERAKDTAGVIALLDLETLRVERLHVPGLGSPKAVAVTPDAARAVVADGRRIHVVSLAGTKVDTLALPDDLARLLGSASAESVAATDTRIAVGFGGASAAVVTALLDPGADGGHGLDLAFTWSADTIDALALEGDVVLAATGSRFGLDPSSRDTTPHHATNELVCFRLRDGGGAVAIGDPCQYDSYGRALALAPDRRTLLVGTGNGNLYRFSFDRARGCELVSRGFRGKGAFTQELGSEVPVALSGEVHGIAFLDPDQFVAVSIGNASVSGSAEVRCFALDGRETLLQTLDGQDPTARRRPAAQTSVAFARRRGLLLVGTAAGEVEVWRR
jgi:hypothetical protein